MTTKTKNIRLRFADFENDELNLDMNPLGILVSIYPEFTDEGEVSVLLGRDEARKLEQYLTADFTESAGELTLQDGWGDTLWVRRNDGATLTFGIQMEGKQQQAALLHSYDWNELVEAFGNFNY